MESGDGSSSATGNLAAERDRSALENATGALMTTMGLGQSSSNILCQIYESAECYKSKDGGNSGNDKNCGGAVEKHTSTLDLFYPQQLFLCHTVLY